MGTTQTAYIASWVITGIFKMLLSTTFFFISFALLMAIFNMSWEEEYNLTFW
jgi:hypothetical protein